jgi:hypothetical protein
MDPYSLAQSANLMKLFFSGISGIEPRIGYPSNDTKSVTMGQCRPCREELLEYAGHLAPYLWVRVAASTLEVSCDDVMQSFASKVSTQPRVFQR